LSCNHNKVKELRQSILSCNVENKEKITYLEELYISINKKEVFKQIMNVYNSSEAMQEVNKVLEELKKLGKLNNKNIPRMVKNYFIEMCFVVYEMARVLKSNGYCVMVNDNVRYGGEEIPIDLILLRNLNLILKKYLCFPRERETAVNKWDCMGEQK